MTTGQKYVIVNDTYSNQPDIVTFEELKEMCKENGWECKLRKDVRLFSTGAYTVIVDEVNNVVAMELERYVQD